MKFLVKTAVICSVLCCAAFSQAAVIWGSASCDTSSVTAGGFTADDCEGLFAKSKGAGAGPNDSESFLNNALSLQDGTSIWGNEGAFGFNDWDFLGKDDFNSYSFLNASSGNPGSWSLDSLVSGSFVIAVKQAGELGLWYFENLSNLSGGSFDHSIFKNPGWSHVAIYGRETSVPEPSTVFLLILGLVGLLYSRNRI